MTKRFILPVVALLLSTVSFAAFADSYGNADISTTTTSTASSTSGGSTSSEAFANRSSYGGNTYDWNPFTQNEGVYISGQAGGSFPTGDDLEDDASYAVSLGYQFHPMIRAEIEGAYRNNDLDGFSGDADTYTAMLNAFWDFKNQTRFTPYIGGGIGWAFSNLEAPGFDEDDNAFVYQLGAGASYNLNENWALTADYRWVDTADFDYGAGGDEDYSAHEIRAGVRYTF